MLDELLADRLVSRRVECEMRSLSQVIAEQGVDRIDLLKIDVEKGELDVLAGIEEQDWDKIRQLMVGVYDVDGRADGISAMLRRRGYTVSFEQDSMLAETPYRNIFATRGGGGVAAGRAGGGAPGRRGRAMGRSGAGLLRISGAS